MGLQYLQEELDKLLAINEKFGKWEDELTEYLSGGKLLSIKLFEILKKTPIDWNTFGIVNSIASYTLDTDVEDFEDDLNQAIKRRKIKSFERKNIGYSLITKDDSYIRFLQLTDFIPALDEDVKNRLHTMQRCVYCHWDSIHLAENMEEPCKVVSGFCTMQSKKMAYPHSWVELEHQDREWVIDFTLNLVMNKDGYYKLFNPQNTITIDNTTLTEDLKLRERTSLNDEDIRMYLFHPNEAREVMLDEIASKKSYETGEFPWLMIEK